MRTCLKLPVFLLLAVVILSAGAVGQTADQSQPKPLDQEYRKFNDLVSVLRDRNKAQFAIDPTRGIDEESYIEIGGIEQWVTIRGQDRNNPVLLFLHGGPGDVTNPWTFAIFAGWEKVFTVVQWDQRGAGRTLRKTGPAIAPTITVERMTQDGIELAEYLRKHLGKEKIFLVGHSFGSILGVRMARLRPELFYAYVGTGQIADEKRNYAVAYDALLKKARERGDVKAVAELGSIGPPPYANSEGFRTQRKWANAFEGADQFLYATIGLTLVAPGNSVQDINDTVAGEMLSADRLASQTKSDGPKEIGLDFHIPVFIFQGSEDFTAPTELARQYLAQIHAPRTAFVEIQGGGHFAVFMKSDVFLQELVKRVRPLAAGAAR